MVSFQLPNWWEFPVLHLACLKLGAVSNPLMVIFRERELGFMLDLAESKVLVVPRQFRGFDYPAMVAGVRDRLPALRRVFVAGGEASPIGRARTFPVLGSPKERLRFAFGADGVTTDLPEIKEAAARLRGVSRSA